MTTTVYDEGRRAFTEAAFQSMNDEIALLRTVVGHLVTIITHTVPHVAADLYMSDLIPGDASERAAFDRAMAEPRNGGDGTAEFRWTP